MGICWGLWGKGGGKLSSCHSLTSVEKKSDSYPLCDEFEHHICDDTT